MKNFRCNSATMFLFAIVLFTIVTCSKDSEDATPEVAEKFTLVGTWNVDRVDVAATIDGTSDTDTDNNPSGTLKFNANGTGSTDYRFSVFGDTYVSDSPISYTLSGNTLSVVDEANTTFTFTLSNQVPKSMEANTKDITLGTVDTDIDIFLIK